MKPQIKAYVPPTVHELRCALIRQRFEMAKARHITALENPPQVATLELVQLELDFKEAS